MYEKIFIILLANYLYFAKTICFKYVSDDLPVYHNPPKTKNKIHKILLWLEGSIRIHPDIDHLLTMTIHALVCMFIYLGFGTSNISFIAALLFAFNPSNSQGSVWISGRSYALAALGMVLCLTFPYLSVIFMSLSTLTNPGFLAPLCFVGSKYAWILLFYPIAVAINIRRFARNVKYKMDKEMVYEDKQIKLEKIILVIKSFGFYTLLALVPFKNSFYHSFLQSAAGSGKEKAYSIKDRYFWIGLIFVVGILYYWVHFPWNMVSFGLLWWCVCLAPFLNMFRMSQEIAERYIYLPNVGLMYCLATVIASNPITVAVFLTIYMTKMWFLMEQYQDDFFLQEHACINSPNSWFAWHCKAYLRWNHNSRQEAYIFWRMARDISPLEFKVNVNLASVMMLTKNMDKALEFIKCAEDNIPRGQETANKEIIKVWRDAHSRVVRKEKTAEFPILL